MTSTGKNVKDELKVEKKDVNSSHDKKYELKLKGDLGYDCNYYNGSNHLAKDCMLRKKEEKKEKVMDEAYYDEKIKEIRARTKGFTLVERGGNEEEGNY